MRHYSRPERGNCEFNIVQMGNRSQYHPVVMAAAEQAGTSTRAQVQYRDWLGEMKQQHKYALNLLAARYGGTVKQDASGNWNYTPPGAGTPGTVDPETGAWTPGVASGIGGYEAALQNLLHGNAMQRDSAQRAWQGTQNNADRRQQDRDRAVALTQLQMGQGNEIFDAALARDRALLERERAFQESLMSNDPSALAALFLLGGGNVNAGLATGADALTPAALSPTVEAWRRYQELRGTPLPDAMNPALTGQLAPNVMGETDATTQTSQQTMAEWEQANALAALAAQQAAANAVAAAQTEDEAVVPLQPPVPEGDDELLKRYVDALKQQRETNRPQWSANLLNEMKAGNEAGLKAYDQAMGGALLNPNAGTTPWFTAPVAGTDTPEARLRALQHAEQRQYEAARAARATPFEETPEFAAQLKAINEQRKARGEGALSLTRNKQGGWDAAVQKMADGGVQVSPVRLVGEEGPELEVDRPDGVTVVIPLAEQVAKGVKKGKGKPCPSCGGVPSFAQGGYYSSPYKPPQWLTPETVANFSSQFNSPFGTDAAGRAREAEHARLMAEEDEYAAAALLRRSAREKLDALGLGAGDFNVYSPRVQATAPPSIFEGVLKAKAQATGLPLDFLKRDIARARPGGIAREDLRLGL